MVRLALLARCIQRYSRPHFRLRLTVSQECQVGFFSRGFLNLLKSWSRFKMPDKFLGRGSLNPSRIISAIPLPLEFQDL